MSLQWCRLYAETVDDAKLKLLAFEDRWHFIALLCLKTQGVLDSTKPELLDRVVGAKLGLGIREADEVRRRLAEVDLIAEDWQPLAWDRRQFKSDDSTARVREWRAKKSSPTPPPTEPDSDTDTDTEGKRCKQRSRNVSETLRMDEIKQKYPRRSGGNPWPRAEKAIRARLKEGSTLDELLEGIERYRKFCEATGKLGTEYVMQAATFFGPDRRYLEPWTPPPTKSQAKQDANVAASLTWLESRP